MPELLEKQLLLYKGFSLGVKEDDFLFPGEHGNLIFPGTFLDWLKRALDMAELPNFTIHSLRHTNITLQIASGVPLNQEEQDIQEHLQQTIYIHIS